MTREEFITLYKNSIYERINGIELITKYCEEFGKSKEAIKTLQLFLLCDSDLFYYMVNYVITYYRNKFSIYLLFDKHNKLIKIF